MLFIDSYKCTGERTIGHIVPYSKGQFVQGHLVILIELTMITVKGVIQEGHIRKPSWFYDKNLKKVYFVKVTF